MTIETSNGKPRVTRPRLSAVTTVDADSDRARDRDGKGRFVRGNTAQRHQGAKRVLTARLRRTLTQELDRALDNGNGSEGRGEAAKHALTLYNAGRRELLTESPIALSHLVRWATGTAAASELTARAHEAGLHTDEGRKLLTLAHQCEGRAERASVAAVTLARQLARDVAQPQPRWIEST